MGIVSERMQNEIREKLGIDVAGFGNEIHASGMQHILKRHGENGTPNRSMQNMEDIGRMRYVIEQYDVMEDTGKRTWGATDKNHEPAPLIRLAKKVNGTYYVVEAVPDSAAKKLRVITAYMAFEKSGKKKSGKASQLLDMETSSPEPTSETGFERDLSATPIVPYRAAEVKKNRSTKADTARVPDPSVLLQMADQRGGRELSAAELLQTEQGKFAEQSETVLDKTWEKVYDGEEKGWAEKNGYTLLTGEDRKRISQQSGWSQELVFWIDTQEQYEFLRKVGLHEENINERRCLVKNQIDAEYVSVSKKGERFTNRERMLRGRSPYDSITGEIIELHHLGQASDSPFVELTEIEHRRNKNSSVIHTNTKPSFRNNPKNRRQYDRYREEHWRTREKQ